MATNTNPQTADLNKDIYWHGVNDQAEVERLDAMHNGIKTYLDGKFFLAPLDKPQTILDVGTGSGIWAIEAAEKFPEASVIGVDISPMPPRPTPSNFEFRQLNILEASPWEAGTFDVVHVRFLFIHLPNPQQIVPQIVQLVKPGGWLLLEEVSLLDSFEGDAQGVRTAFESLRKYWESNNQTPATGTQLESWLNQTGAFSEVNVHEAVAPIGAVTADPKRNILGKIFKDSFRRGFNGKTNPGVVTHGFTPEIKEQCLKEYDTVEWRKDMPLHIVWARKSV